ncbi:hypothetical protein V3C99_009097 [Haemonchus contortus]|uniref:Chromo domain-containing protein n=1 Tax=Haemonchus contortus TaxID=6289 RepID=A0A7I4YLH0_HAECO|nr:Chromo domain containing protein [Haemonchus contortus]
MTPRVKDQIKKEETAKEQEKKEGTSDETEQSYSVEKILASRKRAGRREYLIKWEGYPDEEATWEAECDCDCPDAIAEFNRNKPSRARGGKDDSTVMIGEETPKQSRGARRATMSETKGIEVIKRGRRRTISNTTPLLVGETSSKRTKIASEKPKKEEPDNNASATQNGVRSRRSLDNNEKSSAPQKRRSLKDRIKSEFSERGASYESDEGSVRARFLKTKQIKEDVNSSTESSSYSTDRVYKLQQGKEIENILGVNRDGSRLLYAVQYKGSEPKHQRIELVPSSVLRSHAIEEFVDFLEQLVVANTTHVDV